MPPEGKGKKKGPDPYHLTTGEVGDAKAVQGGFNLHIRILLMLTKASDVPPTPSPELLHNFESRFSSVDRLAGLKAELRKAQPDAIQEANSMARSLCMAVTAQCSPIAANIGRIKEVWIWRAFSIVFAAGLKKFIPDVFSAPDSMYNRVHRMVAIHPFQVIAVGFGYAHMKVDVEQAQNDSLLDQLYENFVFSYWAKLAKAELRKGPGTVVKSIADTNAYRRRVQLGEHRMDRLIAEGLPKRVVRGIAADIECHSDDEGPFPNPANNGKSTIYYINDKIQRNPYITNFYRELDTLRFMAADAEGNSQYLLAERTRQYVADQAKHSKISRRFPPNGTVDYFDPIYFNALPKSLRARYRHSGVALPLPSHWKENWQQLTDTQFMQKYGNEVLKLYQLPTDEEMEGAGDDEEEEEEEDEVDMATDT
ncbi:hypothetical protein B0H17DRAFT_1324227 [Mycena rosella]|uniref:Uncharacterized protein n=1 Tax=Mycena rosella TaxID=1033263 RepID=A0AAD7H249_MYCRO|nr:hypothetical protein B0H17DRAFT_1324227 [Mycena rosella]